MKNLAYYLVLFNFSLLLIGCECYPVRKGIILDERTHLPIENAEITFGSSKCLSDEKGQFEISGSGCDLKMTVRKMEYKPFSATFENKDNNILIEIDNESEYQDIEESEYLDSESATFSTVRSFSMNSVHFEYIGGTDSFVIYLKKEK